MMLRTIEKTSARQQVGLLLMQAATFRQNFQKRLGVYSYKLKKRTSSIYNNPHLVPLHVRSALMKAILKHNMIRKKNWDK